MKLRHNKSRAALRIPREKQYQYSSSKSRMKNPTQKNKRFLSTWWSVDLPEGWSGHHEENCATLSKTPSFGVLQMSAARKQAGPVTDDDLQEVARDQVPSGVRLRRAEFKSFSGFSAVYLKNQLLWREWWLRSGHLMVYVTYNIAHSKEHTEAADLDIILASLKPLGEPFLLTLLNDGNLLYHGDVDTKGDSVRMENGTRQLNGEPL